MFAVSLCFLGSGLNICIESWFFVILSTWDICRESWLLVVLAVCCGPG